MAELNFYLDEQSLLRILIDLKNSLSSFEKIIDAMDSINLLENSQIFICEDFYSLRINDREIAQIIYNGEMDGSIRDELIRLHIIISRSNTCSLSPTNEHGLSALKNAARGGLISELKILPDWWDVNSMFFVNDENSLMHAIRHFFVKFKLEAQYLDLYCSTMFPKLYFHVPASKIKTIALDYHETLPVFINHLAYLNDYASMHFSTIKQNHVIIAEAGSKGVEMSPESPNTHKNVDAMKERDITINSTAVRCEWHTKLDATVGRVHFYPWKHPKKEVEGIVGEKIIVGIITDHLTV